MVFSRQSSIGMTVVLFVCCSLFNGCSDEVLNCEVNENIVNLSSDASPIHDPAMLKMGDTYYVYSSSDLGSFYSSPDMHNWTFAGTVFEEIPPWLLDHVPAADHIGAPDISYYNGQYLLFYQSHKSGTCDAATGLATNQSLDPKSPNYKWVDHGLVLRSKPYIPGIDVICGDGNSIYNAIDPHFFQDRDGTPWLAFGSTIGGIRLVKLDPITLMPGSNPGFITLAQRFLLQSDPIIEGAYIIYRSGYYYLFLSFNHCCLREETKYQVRVGRAEKVTGPYYDREGWPLYLEGGTLIIDKDGPLIGTGHNSIFSEDGVDWLVHHAKDSEQDYRPVLNIRKIEWDDQKWPSVCRK
jgi:arabinan endo-1,5-alpha-L-arabinosidase